MSAMRSSFFRFALLAVGVVVAGRAHAAPVLHENIADDAESDLAMGAVVAGDIPAIVETPAGLIGAPDPRRPPGASENAYGAGKSSSVPGVQPDASFLPDRDTRRPDTLPYDDPFTPSTAPFKRLVAYDAVRADFSLTVNRPQQRPLPTGSPVDGADDRFFGDIVVDAQPGMSVRIPTVGPDARVLHAHLAAGAKDLKFKLSRDDADNWFIDVFQPTRARLVIDLAIRRAAFGGEIAKSSWSELPRVAPLPANVAASAKIVAEKIGVSREQAPYEVIKRLVAYFRAFKDSEEIPKVQRDVYLDLALSQKGVCRHRAFAFLVTALGLGIPSRMILNEAHAWVEVHDGRLWRRIDLGGAGRMLSNPLAARTSHIPPNDAFGWPPDATRGEDIAGINRSATPAATAQRPGARPAGSAGARGPNAVSAPVSSAGGPAEGGEGSEEDGTRRREKDSRPPSTIQGLALARDAARRGDAVTVSGVVTSAKERCGFVTVELVFREEKGRHEVRVGAVATDAQGAFSGSIVVPPTMLVGNYELVARTEGDLRCGASQ